MNWLRRELCSAHELAAPCIVLRREFPQAAFMPVPHRIVNFLLTKSEKRPKTGRFLTVKIGEKKVIFPLGFMPY